MVQTVRTEAAVMVKRRRRWNGNPPVQQHGDQRCGQASSGLYDIFKNAVLIALIMAIAVLAITWALEAAEEYRRKEFAQRPQQLLLAGSAALNRYFDKRDGADGGGVSSTRLEVKTHNVFNRPRGRRQQRIIRGKTAQCI